VAEELERRGWNPEQCQICQKHTRKTEIAGRLRAETTVTLKWISDHLHRCAGLSRQLPQDRLALKNMRMCATDPFPEHRLLGGLLVVLSASAMRPLILRFTPLPMRPPRRLAAPASSPNIARHAPVAGFHSRPVGGILHRRLRGLQRSSK
jgi:hypothetical protein